VVLGGAGTAEGSRVINVVTACSLWGGGMRLATPFSCTCVTL
jgi:hypothetical protein